MRLRFALAVLCASVLRADTVSPLAARGYTVLPAPQRAELGAADLEFGPGWSIDTSGVPAGDIAVSTLRDELGQRFRLRFEGPAARVLRLVLAPGSVEPGPTQDRDREAISGQAYRLELAPERITISANAPAGLFYGAVTFLQLVKPSHGRLLVPEGRIEDWPDLGLRHIYWDDAHHLDRLGALKDALRQAAFFKINGFAIKLEGHFQFRGAPALVEPQAMTPAEFQELTDYGLRYHVEVIPYLDAPGHIAFILKHPEYAKLRAFPASNYEMCVTNPEAVRLMQAMYQDLLDANRGGKYFYLSTDEAYYIGLASNPQCQEAEAARKAGSVGRLLAKFLQEAAGYLHERGRTVMFWGEYPLKAEDIPSLPEYLVNGEVYGPEFDAAFRKHGIRQMIYTSSQGEERLFPEYYPLPASKRLHGGRAGTPRVEGTWRKLAFDTARRDAGLIGMVNAAWADAGLHTETFWLGYATSTGAGWNPLSPSPEEATAAFYPIYYGRGTSRMDRVYRLMSEQAQFWSDSWETVESKWRKPIWGRSDRIYDKPVPAHDQSLELPPAPGSGLEYRADWAQANARRLGLAEQFRRDNGELLGLLHENLRQVEFHRYSLEVFVSIAELCRQNLEFLAGLASIDRQLRAASDAARKNAHRDAVNALDRVPQLARSLQISRNRVLADATATWYNTWLPRVAEANGRKFLHELDDVKDHVPDRTVDMSYLVYRELNLPLGEWAGQVLAARNRYAAAHGIAARSDRFDWRDLKPLSAAEAGEISLE